MSRILYVTSEAHPLMKTGGLGDVAGSLPRALQGLGEDVRLIMPAYGDTLARTGELPVVAELTLAGGTVRLRAGTLPGSHVQVWLVDHPPSFARPGNPYVGPDHMPWHDNADRFALFARAVVEVAMDRAGLRWRPDLVHCNDWQSGLVPALIAQEPQGPPPARPATVFTIHNMAYQGLFPYSTFVALGLPDALWQFEALEFHGQLSFMKGGLVFADEITTVSPSYAREIQSPEFGFGLDGLLRHRGAHLSGILNGIDETEWDPGSDPHLVQNYTARNLVGGKRANKRALQEAFGLPVAERVPLIGMIGRLVQQKGIDQLLDALPSLMGLDLQIVLLGSGEPAYEGELHAWAARYPERLAARIGFDEQQAHRIEAGADLFLMPSRFEPCGLNQMYSLRYGTLPIVRAVGGLADTVIDADEANIASGRATGIVFGGPGGGTPAELVAAIGRGLDLFADTAGLRKVQRAAMRQDHSWQRSAGEYLALYARALGQAAPGTRAEGAGG